MKIVVADDERTAQLLLKAALRSLGHEAVIVDDGQAALDVIERESIPLVISDWMMPRVSGVELCREVRRREAERLARGQGQSYTYLILLTALDGKANYLEAMDAGADDLVTKPFDHDTLVARLRVAERILGLLRAVQQLSGLLPICAYCKKIREGEDRPEAPRQANWVPIESYVSHRTDASFSHGVCPDCYETVLRPQLEERRRARRGE